MLKGSYFSDQRLEIIILGPMRGEKKDTSLQIRNAMQKILEEAKAQEILRRYGITPENIKINRPEQWQSSGIEGEVFFNLDTADLVVVNIPPREGEKNTTPNVFYELGLVHALGLPYILIIEEGNEVPFYMRSTRYYPVKNFKLPALVRILREPMYTFIDDSAPYSFTENIIFRFYEGLPVVDISAAVGLTTRLLYEFCTESFKGWEFYLPLSRQNQKTGHCQAPQHFQYLSAGCRNSKKYPDGTRSTFDVRTAFPQCP